MLKSFVFILPLTHGDNYTKYAKIYFQYIDLKDENKDKFFNKHREAIIAFTEAHEYMSFHLNERKQIPLAEWKNEFAELTVKRDKMLTNSEALSAELQSAEVIKRYAEKVIGTQAQRLTRTQEMVR